MTVANQAAAAARNGNYTKAAALYDQAALQAELELNERKARKHRARAADYARRADND